MALCASDRAWATFTQHRLEARRLNCVAPEVNARVEPRAPRDRIGLRQRAQPRGTTLDVPSEQRGGELISAENAGGSFLSSFTPACPMPRAASRSAVRSRCSTDPSATGLGRRRNPRPGTRRSHRRRPSRSWRREPHDRVASSSPRRLAQAAVGTSISSTTSLAAVPMSRFASSATTSGQSSPPPARESTGPSRRRLLPAGEVERAQIARPTRETRTATRDSPAAQTPDALPLAITRPALA